MSKELSTTTVSNQARQHFDIGNSLFLVRYSFKILKHIILKIPHSLLPRQNLHRRIEGGFPNRARPPWRVNVAKLG